MVSAKHPQAQPQTIFYIVYDPNLILLSFLTLSVKLLRPFANIFHIPLLLESGAEADTRPEPRQPSSTPQRIIRVLLYVMQHRLVLATSVDLHENGTYFIIRRLLY